MFFFTSRFTACIAGSFPREHAWQKSSRAAKGMGKRQFSAKSHSYSLTKSLAMQATRCPTIKLPYKVAQCVL